MLRTLLWIVLWIVPVLWAAFAWWSWRKVRRNEVPTHIALLRAVPGLGMGVWGLGMWLYVALTQALNEVRNVPLADAIAIGRFWGELALALAIGFPLWLWGDFLFRRGMIWFLGIQGRPAPPPPDAAD